jgi:hypothetical protein
MSWYFVRADYAAGLGQNSRERCLQLGENTIEVQSTCMRQ